MPTYHEFNPQQISKTLKAAAESFDLTKLRAADGLVEPRHVVLAAAECISVTADRGKICLKLPLKIGDVCIPIPAWIGGDTVVQACIGICTTWGIPTGVEVTISVAGHVVAGESWGRC